MHSERCTSGSARGHAKLPVARSARRACSTQPYLPATVIGMWFHLYLILDLYSRKIVGWEVHATDDSVHAAHLVRRTAFAEGIATMLTKPVLHGDNGATLKATTVLAMLYWLGVKPSYCAAPRERRQGLRFILHLLRTIEDGHLTRGVQRGLGAWCRELRMVARRLVKAFVFVAVGVSTKQAALQPPLDRRGRDLQRVSHFLQRQ